MTAADMSTAHHCYHAGTLSQGMGLQIAQISILGVSTLAAVAAALITLWGRREERKDRKEERDAAKLADVERRIERVGDRVVNLATTAHAVEHAQKEMWDHAFEPGSANPMGQIRPAVPASAYTLAQRQLQAALAALRPVGPRLPRCEALLEVPSEQAVNAADGALEEVAAALVQLLVDGPPSHGAIMASSLLSTPVSPADRFKPETEE